MPRTNTHREQDPPHQPGGGQSPARPGSHGGGWQQVLDALRAAGAEAGANAADWWAQDTVGGRASGDTAATARMILAGIDDGDALTLDTLPGCDLSRPDADTPTCAEVYTDAAPADAPGWEGLDAHDRAEAIDAFRDGHQTAVQDRAAEHCRTALPDDATGSDRHRCPPTWRIPGRAPVPHSPVRAPAPEET